MAFGTVLENLSTKKLSVLAFILLVAQLICFLLGGILAPNPANVQSVLGSKCLAANRKRTDWFYPRGTGQCVRFSDLDGEKIQRLHIGSNQIVFAFQIPLPKNNVKLRYSRWFQNLISVMEVEIEYKKDFQYKTGSTLTLDARLGYRDYGDGEGDWKELAVATVERPLECHIDDDRRIDGYHYNCSLLPFFELGSCHHDFYLINVRIPVHDKTNQNMGIGHLKELWLTVINQNGGFTKVWVSLKTVMFPAVLACLIWFWNRVRQEPRPPTFLEKSILTLGVATTQLNIPLEWFTLAFDMPWHLIVTDIRQGVFYTVLLSFWLIYLGEHYMETSASKIHDVMTYWRHLLAVGAASLAMFLFEMCERGVQLSNPFYSIWSTESGAQVAYAFLVLTSCIAVFYFLFLLYMVVCVVRRVSGKRAQLPAMSSVARRLYYQGLIYRFQVVLLMTVVCAASTVVFFVLSQMSEGSWRFDDHVTIEYTSAFYTGVYGMWNVYTFLVLCLYAPSHKNKSTLGHLNITVNPEDEDENIEFQQLNAAASNDDAPKTTTTTTTKTTSFTVGVNEASAFTAFMTKQKD